MNLIFLGDSLMQPNGESTYPQTGWPQALDDYLKDKDKVKIQDFALNGRSTKSFIDEGRFNEALEVATAGDICFISFGHNDEKYEDPKRYTDPYGQYQRNLIYMENEMKKKGVKTIFISSISRLKYDKDGKTLLHTHKEYPNAMKEVAKQLNDPFIDLEMITYNDLSKYDYESNSRHYMIFEPGKYENYPDGSKDTTHLCFAGAKWICSLVVEEFKKISDISYLFI